jgi:lauroyl/myristoyl acyltransferase
VADGAPDALYPAPPWRWAGRAALIRHWVRDPALGLGDSVMHHALRLLPTETASAIGARLGLRAGRRKAEASARARALLRALRPAAAPAEIEALLAAHWAHIGRCYAEFSALHRLWAEGRIEVAGLEHLDAARQQGRAVLVAGLHVGAWEVVHAGLSALRIPVTGVYQRLPNRFQMRIADAARRRSWRVGEPVRRIAPTSRALFEAQRVLATPGGVMLYYVDEYWRGRVHAPALGRALRPEGNVALAARLAAATGAALIPAYALRLGGEARFRLTFLPEVPLGPAGRHAALDNQARLDAAIAGVVRAHPEQWFMLHVFRPDAGLPDGG